MRDNDVGLAPRGKRIKKNLTKLLVEEDGEPKNSNIFTLHKMHRSKRFLGFIKDMASGTMLCQTNVIPKFEWYRNIIRISRIILSFKYVVLNECYRSNILLLHGYQVIPIPARLVFGLDIYHMF